MKSLLNLGAGGAWVAIWEKIPGYVKYPVVFGLGMLAASELTIDANHAFWSGRIFMGQAAQGDAQEADPAKTRADMQNGRPVTGAQALLATQVDQVAADAKQKTADANAAAATIEDIRARLARGQKVTAAEALKLKEYEIREQELRLKRAEATTKEVEAVINSAILQFFGAVIDGASGGPSKK